MRKIGVFLSLTIALLISNEQTTSSKNSKNVDISSLTLSQIIELNPEIAKEVAHQCNIIFDARKEEISLSLFQLQEQQSSIKILTNENTKLLNQKQNQLQEKENALKKMYEDMKEEETKTKQEAESKLEEAKKILAQNEELLKEIKNIKDSKLSESYAKMKDTNAALILANLPNDDAIKILLTLQSKQMGLILSKMQPQKAAELTELIQYYPSKKPVPPPPPPAPQNDGININNMPSENAEKTQHKIY